MVNKNIHGFNVEYNEESDVVKSYMEHFEYDLSHEEVKAFIESAKHDPLHKIHVEDRHSNMVTLEYKDDNSCLIRKRNI